MKSKNITSPAKKPAPIKTTHTPRLEPLICLGLVVAVFIVFGQTYQFGFVNYDDNLYITGNDHTKAGLTFANVQWAFTTGEASNWHPLTWLSHMLDVQIFGENAGPHHIVNVLFHAINAVLLFLVLLRMTNARWASTFVAALFAIHPLHVESVAWIAERKDVLSTFFWLLTMTAYVRYVRRPGIFRYLLIAIPLTLGLMTKPMLVTLPAVLLLLDYWPLRRFDGDSGVAARALRLTLEKAPLFLLAGASSVITFLAQHSGHSVAALSVLPVHLRIENALISYVRYIYMTLWPTGLTVFYPHPGPSLAVWQAIISVIALAGISTAVVWGRRRHPYLVTGWLWYLGTLVPVIGIVQVGAQALADRYTYVPLIGLFIMAAWGIGDHVTTSALSKQRYLRPALGVLTALVLIVLSACAAMQVSYWKDSITLFEHALKVTTKNHLAHKNLGVALAEEHKYKEAIEHYAKGAQIKSDDADLFYNMGNALGELGRQDEAIAQYMKALSIKPDHIETHYNLGNAYAKQDKYSEAIAEYQETIRLKPDHLGARINMGNSLAMMHKPAEASDVFQEALKMDPANEEALINIGNTFAEQNKLEEAIANYQKALKVNSRKADTHANLGYAYLRIGRPQDALASFNEVLRIDPGNAKIREQIKNIQAAPSP